MSAQGGLRRKTLRGVTGAIAGLSVIIGGCASAEPTGAGDQGVCAVPWTDIDQLFDCAMPGYTVVDTVFDDEERADIVVQPKDTATIAAALAHAWASEIPADQEGEVWAWSRAVQIGFGYDRGVMSERDGLLLFEICTAWGSGGELGELCTDTLTFSIER